MAYDYNNYEKFYNAMNDSQRAKWNEQNKNDADFNDFMSKYNAKNQTSTPVSNVSNTTSTGKASSQTAVPEYWGTWASNAKQSNYVNQWEGNYKYNPTTWYYEKQWTSTGTTTPTTPTQTSTTSTPSSVSTPKSDTVSSMKEYWDSLDYAQQQEKLKANPSLKEWLARYWITSKTAPVESTWTTWDTGKTWWTTPADKWDYSDNSPERMAEIADNVNRFYNTNPGIFESEDSFRNFFIDWKGRTPEQEAFLMDFYKNRKKYNELDNYTADEIWAMDVHWYVPESYLTYLKNSDPERYAAVMDAKAKEQDKIKDKTSLETTNVMTWEDDENTITSKAIEWLKAQWLFVDKDWNFIDDRTENYATDEEKQYAKDAADIIARNLDIDNTVKHTYDDLVEKYPWATKATLMAMAQDINSDLLREKENNNVELTRLQWYMDYMQSERQERNRIWENAIEQLQKQYGMYYTYSPEWMSELAQAQYAATNVTLDQADNWTDTQKQMALQSVLDDYYAKYWDIIQRSEAQVINDVMAYAKKNGVSLSQALEENFLKYLRQKPEFATLSSGWLSPTVSFEKVWDTWYVFTVNPDGTYSLESVWWAAIWSWVAWWTYNNDTWVMNFTESWMKWLWLKNNNPWNITDSNVWEVWRNGKFAVFETPEDWFDALVAKIQNAQNGKSKNYPATATLYEFFAKYAPSSDNNNPKAYAESVAKQLGVSANTQIKDLDTVKFAAAIAKHDSWYNYDTYWMFRWWSGDNNNWYDPLLKEFFQKDPTKLTKDQWAKLKNMWYDERTYLTMRNNYLKNLAKEPDSWTVKILDTLWYLMTNYPWREALMGAFATSWMPWWYWEKMWDYLSYIDYIQQNLTMDNLTKLKANGATFGSLTEWEWPRIEASASRLSRKMSEEKFKWELLNIYNTYAEKAWMWTLTLDDINEMYWWKSSNWAPFNTPSFLQNKTTVTQSTQDWNIDYDARFSEYSG